MLPCNERNAWLIQHCFSPYGTTQLEKTGKKGSFGPQKDPFGGSWCPRWAQGGQIWSQLHPIGPPGLDSWSPHTLTWYRALSTAQFLSGCIVYQPLITCTIFIRAPANYRVVHLVILFVFARYVPLQLYGNSQSGWSGILMDALLALSASLQIKLRLIEWNTNK